MAVGNDNLLPPETGDQRLRTGRRAAIEHHVLDAFEGICAPGAIVIRRVAFTRGVSGASPRGLDYRVMGPEKVTAGHDCYNHQKKKSSRDGEFERGDSVF